MKGQAEYRRFSRQFRPSYFDDLYEKARARYDETRGVAISKAATLSDTSMRGVYGDAAVSLGPFLTASASYQYLSGRGGASNQRFRMNVSVPPALLDRIPYIGQASGYYEKYNIDTRQAGFFDSTLDTFYGYVLGLDISRDVSVIWETRFTFDHGGSGGLRRNKVLNIQAVGHF